MNNNKKYWIFGGLALLLIIAVVIVIAYVKNPTKLTLEERNWINDNSKNVVNIMVLNNDNVFGYSGKGVFYDYLNDFSSNYSIEINPVTYNNNEEASGLYLGKSNAVSTTDSIFYKDHYVLISKNYELVKNTDDLRGKAIGISNSNISYVSSYLTEAEINYASYDNSALAKALIDDEVSYILVPLYENIDFILNNNLVVIYHFSDINYYYYLKDDGSVCASVLKKYFIEWQNKLSNYQNDNLFNLFVSDLKLTGTEVADLQNKDYNYGFVNNSPYEVITGGNYGGIVAVYLQKFSDFSGVNFNFKRYKNYDRFIKALDNNKVDLYFNIYNNNGSVSDIKLNMPVNFDVIINEKDNTIINSLASLQNKEVYVLDNSLLADYASRIKGIKLKTYQDNRELIKIAKKNVIILVDHNVYLYYKTNKLSHYSSRFNGVTLKEYSFRIKNNESLVNIFAKYVNILDSKEIINEGFLNHYNTVKSGTVLGTIARYILYVLIIVFAVIIYLYKKTKKITIIKRIKKEDKLKYIDQLTSLKNRNYLSENIETWNNNTVYPQAIIVMDLNNVQHINDTLGYEEGDKQIKSLANSLIKTQLDYTDIIRTDGNEFLIYMVGYSQKQVASYIHKLNKEIKRLPYEYGAEFGYSMILDDLKSVEDAMNEATEQMKKQKKEKKENEKEESED